MMAPPFIRARVPEAATASPALLGVWPRAIARAAAGRVRARVAGAFEDKESYIDFLEEKKKVALAVVEARLAACVNILPRVQSIYRWQGAIERVTNKVFLLSPHNVTVAAEDKRRIAEGGFFNQS